MSAVAVWKGFAGIADDCNAHIHQQDEYMSTDAPRAAV